MRVYVIHPGADFSTSDVYDGLVAGLRETDGVDVYEGRINTILNWYDAAVSAATAAGYFSPAAVDNNVLNRQRLASAHITQHILDVWPDLIICVSGHNYHLQDARALKRIGFKTAVLLTEAPYFGDLEKQIASAYSVAFTNERLSAPLLGAHYLPHAYHPTRHRADGPKGDASDVLFIGSLFAERKALFEGVNWTSMQFVRRGHDLISPVDIVPNEQTAAYYRSARICINHHRTSAGDGDHIAAGSAESLNPRAYEISACGAFQLMDDSREERYDIFGDTVPTYRSGNSADLTRRLHYWLDHDDRREETARMMHAAVQPHSWVNRARQLLEVLA
jgi:spore maturation protein CgeB